MPGRPVSMAVDQARVIVLAQCRFDGLPIYIHDLRRFAPFLRLARPAQCLDRLLAAGEGLGKKSGLPTPGSYFGTKLLVIPVVGAQRVAVHQQGALLEQLQYKGFFQEPRVTRGGKVSSEQEVPVSVHEIQRRPPPAEICQRVDHRGVEGVNFVVIACPVLKQVPENVQGLCLARRPDEEVEKYTIDLWPPRAQMQIGDENDGQVAF